MNVFLYIVSFMSWLQLLLNSASSALVLPWNSPNEVKLHPPARSAVTTVVCLAALGRLITARSLVPDLDSTRPQGHLFQHFPL